MCWTCPKSSYFSEGGLGGLGTRLARVRVTYDTKFMLEGGGVSDPRDLEILRLVCSFIK